MLPSGPKWQVQSITVDGYPTKAPVDFYYRDALECVRVLYGNPLFSGYIENVPTRMFRSRDRDVRVYSEWMTGDESWEMQVCLSFLRWYMLYSLSPRVVFRKAQLCLVLYYPPTKLPSQL